MYSEYKKPPIYLVTGAMGCIGAWVLYHLVRQGKQVIGFDLSEVGISDTDWNSNVGARILFKLCNLLVTSNS